MCIPDTPRIAAAERLAKALGTEVGHARQVTRLSCRLFCAFEPLHGRGEAALELLCCGAWLHDVGLGVGPRGHHKHSLRLIMDSPMPELSAREKSIVANVARYHRKALPKPIHEPYADLDREAQDLVCCLAALLRIADGLDRAHLDAVERLQAGKVSPQVWELAINGPGDLDLAIWGAERKADLFEATYGVRLTMVAAVLPQ
jgi:exopolyphosphatase/guanosine-5'-triphosphate,3'-diphosphate pyrophosphatase